MLTVFMYHTLRSVISWSDVTGLYHLLICNVNASFAHKKRFVTKIFSSEMFLSRQLSAQEHGDNDIGLATDWVT